MTDSKPKKTKITIKDPNAATEAEKYENPVASRDALLMVLEALGRPATHEEVCEALSETDEDRVEAIRRRLIAMSRDGQLISNRRSQFVPIDKTDLIIGKVQGHPDGFGFVLGDDTDGVHLSMRQMSKVFHGDRVAVRIIGYDRRNRPEGRIEKVLERNTQTVVGRFYDQAGFGVVQPDSKRVTQEILITPDGRNNAEHGQFVVVKITQQPQSGGLPMGEIIEVLGNHMAPGMEIDVAIRSHNLPHEWPKEVLSEVENIPDQVTEEEAQERIDLRHLPFVTIDGEDAKDFDDAVYCKRNKSTGGWRLFVAIADVSHYVTVGSALDKEGYGRGNSVYFPEHVLPMLPEALSNGICSLNPEVDRLVMVCEITISKAGNISGYQFMEAVIHSHARLTYNKVWAMVNPEGDEEQQLWRKQYANVVDHVDALYGLYKKLRERREARGALDFESTETRIVFDSERKIQQIVPTTRNDAHMLIEECMLAANQCAASFLLRNKIPSLYRVHAGPSTEKLTTLQSFLGELGLSLSTGTEDPTPQDFQALLARVANRPDSRLIQTVMLRSLSQAVYQPENEGHFGLAFKAYTHFTSPIRRYPDLLIHRGIKSVIRSQRESKQVRRAENAKPLAQKKIYPYDLGAMAHMGEHCSMTERRADEATRDVVDFLKCEYISSRVGEEFEGVITAVTSFGLFVELKDVYVEGLVHVSTLASDFYQFDPVKYRLIGERTRRTYRLGDSLWVKVVGVTLEAKKVAFDLASSPENKDKITPVIHTDAVPRVRIKKSDGTVEEKELKPHKASKKSSNKPAGKKPFGKKPTGKKKSAKKPKPKKAK